MFRPLLLLICVLCLNAPLFAQGNASYPLCSEQPIMSRERIVFTSYYEEQLRDVYITDPESGDVCLLLANMRAVELNWSPDGDEIVFGEFKTENGRGYVDGPHFIYADDTSPREIDWIYVGAQGVNWSPDGTQLAYRRQHQPVVGELIIQDARNGVLIAEYNPDIEDYYVLGQPEWSPDGKIIAVPGVFLMFDIQKPILTDIYMLSLDDQQGLVMNYLAGTSGNDFAPTWSPDGRHIAFTSETDEMRRLMITDLEKGETRESPLAISGYHNTWLPDGRLVFTSEDGDSYGLFVTDASVTGNWTTIERVMLPFNTVQFDWWIDPATIEAPETP